MKIIEGMKLKKELQQKAKDLRQKIATYCAHTTIETPAYGTAEKQQEQIKEWLQAHRDIVKEMRNIALRIQKTNLNTNVEIAVAGKPFTQPIAGWILRRRELANMEAAAWESLGDKSIREGRMTKSDGSVEEVKIVRYFDPTERDKMVDYFKHEPSRIDAKLEVVNAITDLTE